MADSGSCLRNETVGSGLGEMERGMTNAGKTRTIGILSCGEGWCWLVIVTEMEKMRD